jgi:hypothetical protein
MTFLLELSAEQITAAASVLLLVGGTVGFFVGLAQYKAAQVWRRQEFVAAEIKLFAADLQCRNAMQMIDWGTRRIELFPDHPEYEQRFVYVTRPILHEALRAHDVIGRPYTPVEAAVRDCFDAFFNGLDRFWQFVEAGLVSANDFRPYLTYWVRSISEEANPVLRDLLYRYAIFYGFTGAQRLLEQYGCELTEEQPPAQQQLLEVQNKYEELVAADDLQYSIADTAPR